ncbi:PREDICTED: COX assembly mitochondrial protein homolog isoform X2 [Pseudopodoces humilis]|uniref:COX assembly mitochondrial protein homolog isoform X2 n=1 Tax=Pseudopodoces humilis TaxID=181119 RepID=UPI0006B73A5B|nr:PREDICTED: COX assembly mitochondrial protein homolog isoform X2 [Pseudopodoces humilis]
MKMVWKRFFCFSKTVVLSKLKKDRSYSILFCSVQRGDSSFTKCCQESGVLMVVKCRQENTALKDCLVGYYSDPSFYEECKAEYLKQREEYRATGIKKKRQKFTPNV